MRQLTIALLLLLAHDRARAASEYAFVVDLDVETGQSPAYLCVITASGSLTARNEYYSLPLSLLEEGALEAEEQAQDGRRFAAAIEPDLADAVRKWKRETIALALQLLTERTASDACSASYDDCTPRMWSASTRAWFSRHASTTQSEGLHITCAANSATPQSSVSGSAGETVAILSLDFIQGQDMPISELRLDGSAAAITVQGPDLARDPADVLRGARRDLDRDRAAPARSQQRAAGLRAEVHVLTLRRSRRSPPRLRRARGLGLPRLRGECVEVDHHADRLVVSVERPVRAVAARQREDVVYRKSSQRERKASPRLVIVRCTPRWIISRATMSPRWVPRLCGPWSSGWRARSLPSARGHRLLREENRVLREQLGARRLRLTDDQRRRLAVKGQLVGRRRPGEFAGLVTPTRSCASTAS